jgi:hypothetical protein
MNFIDQPQFKPAGPEAGCLCDAFVKLSVLPVGHFVQMRRLAQVKFKSSVAGALHFVA